MPRGKALCTKPVPVPEDPADKDNYPDRYDYNEPTKTLYVGAGAFAPVVPEVYNFEVSA